MKNPEELDDREKYWINKYKSVYPNGYNLTTGGRKNTKPCKDSINLMLGTTKDNKDFDYTIKPVDRTSASYKKLVESLKGSNIDLNFNINTYLEKLYGPPIHKDLSDIVTLYLKEGLKFKNQATNVKTK